MKPFLSRLVAISLALILFPFSSYAEEPINDMDKAAPFPFPAGNVKITNGYSGGPTHQGYSKYALDMQAPNQNLGACDQYGTPIIAVREGVVVHAKNAGEDGSFGTHVIIKSGKNIHIWYAHMIENSLQVSIGEQVKQGQLLGLMGDTGKTRGHKCPEKELVDGNEKKYKKELIGVHVHTEMRDGKYQYEDKNKNIIRPTPLKYTALLGKEVYTNIVETDYISTSLLTKDKNNYWNKMKGYFSYQLPENAIGEVGPDFYSGISRNLSGAETNPLLPKIRSLTPLYPNENEETTYTITGERLSQDLELEFAACQKIEWLERTTEKQQFKCLIDTPGITGGKISIPNVQTNDKKPITMGFDVKVLARGESQGKAIYSGYPKIPSSIEPGDKIELSVIGKNLPEDLTFEIPFCQEVQYSFFGIERQSVRCQLGTMNYDANGKIKNELLTHDIQIKNKEGDIVSQGNLVIDHRIQIESITPSVAYFGQKTSFTLKGKGVEKLNTFHLDSCQNLIVLSSSNLKDQVVIQCTLPVPESFFSPLMPDSLKRKTLNLHIKDKPGGEMILAGKIEAIAFPETWIEKLTPPFPNLGEKTTFTLQGNHLPDKLIYWIQNCSQGELATIKSKTATFTCSPEAVGTNALKKIQIAALKATQNPEQFVKEIEKQRRVVEIKYPREYSQDGKTAITIYRENILPIPKAYRDLYISTLEKLTGKKVPNALWLDEKNDVDVINYILKNQGDYSNTFLKKFGWKNKGSNSNPLYELMNCSDELKNSSKIYGPRQKHNSKLNTTGSCATGLNIELIEKELEKMYPDKNEPPKK